MHQPTVFSTLTVVLAALPAAHAGIYTKNSPVLQLDPRSYEKLIAKSNHTSIVEFYAPWCGHCQNLKPAYEKAAKNLDGLAKVAAVDCDQDSNKALCSAMGVQGFPTLKIVRPGKKAGGKPVVEDYQGPRTATGITDAVVSKINNHVTRIADKDLVTFLAGDKPKAILFTEKGTTSALLRSVAIDFLDVISVGQVRNKEKVAVAEFGIEKFPTLVLVPTEGKEPIVYNGELNKKDVVEFLRQVGEPNPDPAPAKGKGNKNGETKVKRENKASSSKSAPNKEPTPEPEETPESTTEATPKGASASSEVVAIDQITSQEQLAEKCLQAKSTTCILALVPTDKSDKADQAVASLSQLNSKYIHGGRQLFPFLSLPADIEGYSILKTALKLSANVEIVAINARRNWWRQYAGDFSVETVESWVDAIRMGEGAKKTLPKGLVLEQVETASAESSTEAEPEAETGIRHEEL